MAGSLNEMFSYKRKGAVQSTSPSPVSSPRLDSATLGFAIVVLAQSGICCPNRGLLLFPRTSSLPPPCDLDPRPLPDFRFDAESVDKALTSPKSQTHS